MGGKSKRHSRIDDVDIFWENQWSWKRSQRPLVSSENVYMVYSRVTLRLSSLTHLYLVESLTISWPELASISCLTSFCPPTLVCKLQTKILKIPMFGNTSSRHANFTKFFRIVPIDVRNKSWKFHIDISKIGYFTEQSANWRKSWSVKYGTVHKM